MLKSSSAFRQRFVSKVIAAIRDADEAMLLGHPGLIGRIREIILSQLLVDTVTPEVRFGTGKLTDVKGKMSNEIDIILYSPEILPPALYDEKNGIFPVESCLYTIEVKSKVTAQELKKAIANALSVRKLDLLPTDHWVGGKGILNNPTAFPVNALFALSSDLSDDGKSEINRYRELDPNADTDAAVGVICVRGKGYWYLKGKGEEAIWKHVEAADSFDEILDFMAGVSNTIPQLLSVKGRPRFGNYLWSGREFDDV